MALTLIEHDHVIEKDGTRRASIAGEEHPPAYIHWIGENVSRGGGEPMRIVVMKVRSGSHWSRIGERSLTPAEWRIFKIVEGPVDVRDGNYDRRGKHYRVVPLCFFPAKKG